MDNNKLIQDYIFCNYVEMTRKTCFQLILVSSALCLFSVFAFNNKVYLFLSISSTCVIIVWAVLLMFSKKREMPEYKFLSDGISLAYMSFQLLYFGYVLLFNEEKPIICLFLFLTLIGISFFYLQITKRTMQKRTKPYSKVWDFLTIPAVILGYFGAKALFPRLEYEIVIKIGIVVAFFCSLLMGCCCSTKFLKAILIRKYHVTRPSMND